MSQNVKKTFIYFLNSSVTPQEFQAIEGVTFNSDTVFTSQRGLFVGAQQYLFDETTARLVRQRANDSGEVVLASAPRTVTTNSAIRTNFNFKGVHIIIDVTAHGGGLGLVPHIQGFAPFVSGGTFYDLLVGTTITATGVTVIKVYPGIGQIPGGAASDFLPRQWRFQMEHLDATSHTYVAEAELET